MILGIDASNLRGGGGVTHLTSLLGAADPQRHGFREVRVWAPAATGSQIGSRPWLRVLNPRELDRALPCRLAWQAVVLPRQARECDVVFAPGGNAPYSHPCLVAMSQNMLPFEPIERGRYGLSPMRARLALLQRSQAATFRRAAGMIFLTHYAEREVRMRVSDIGTSRVISHGIDERFRIAPRRVRPLSACSFESPLRALYVSIVDVYKHQWHVVAAIAALRRQGLPIRVRFVGPSYAPSLKRLTRALDELDPRREFAEFAGPVPYAALPDEWRNAELCVFASSCENQPNILLEAMAAGVPIACSDRGPMPEVLGDAGVYFQPECPDSIARAVGALSQDSNLRAALGREAASRVVGISWDRCASETFRFLREVALCGRHL